MIIRAAKKEDASLILSFIKELAEFEKLSHEVVATVKDLERHLFGENPVAEVVIAEIEAGGKTNGKFSKKEGIAFALFFQNYSTFLGQPGIYLEDLFVRPPHRGKGVGEAMLRHIAQLAIDRGCGRFEWSVLGWNTKAIEFYKRHKAIPMNEWTVFRLTGSALKEMGAGA